MAGVQGVVALDDVDDIVVVGATVVDDVDDVAEDETDDAFGVLGSSAATVFARSGDCFRP